ncbi:tetratricopeptide repeat protein [Methanococcoides seepicolus]|uniref:Tetratricopeptide repeat protein n=2 Tax=Methanococcoides seepicolus TaxID=2828780 RepID=A0A9E4ZJC1_9EURY|nr:tetratricopeptide repeat protein [Methanococcoides seepicolus]
MSENPNFVDSYTNLGVLYAEDLKDYDKAIEKFEETIILDPSNHKAYSNLILAKLKIVKSENVDWWQTSAIKKVTMCILIFLLLSLILMALYSIILSTFYNESQSIIETNTITESLSNITTTTTRNSITIFSQIMILIGTVVLLLCSPYITKLKLTSSGVEFEMENPREDVEDYDGATK